MEQTKQLYFAYGPNLNKNDWNKYCRDKGIDPGIMRPVGPATLPDEVLVFDHYSSRRNSWTLNIRPHFGSLVAGHLFAVTQDGWDALDKKEGHPDAYRRETVIVLDAKGGEVKATTYRSKRPHGLERPNDEKPCNDYLDICRAGRERFELDTIDIDLAAENEVYSCNLVFVYGTLMRGESRASAWEDLNPDRVLLADSPGTLLDHGSYPALNRAGEGFVLGEVLRFENIEEALARFDRIEGFYGFGNSKNLFRRTVTTFSLVDGPVQTAWTYVTTRPEAPAIPSNDWRVHCGGRLDFVERLVAEHASRKPNFLERVASEASSPFDPVSHAVPQMADVVNLIFGSHCERILARASEDWAVGLPPLIRKHLRSQSVPLLELAQESAGIATPDNSEVSLVRFEPNTDEDVQEASEGRLLTRKHLARERNRKLVETKRRQALETYGKLTCEVCDFDFSASYGDRGHGFIECHHTKPVSTLAEGYSTHINDLVPVCANCHRMLHRTVPWLSISELKAILSPKACKRS